MSEHRTGIDVGCTLASLTLAEKATLLSGLGAWNTAMVERVGIPSIVLTDGPHGVRLQDPRVKEFRFDAGLPATCFPTASALGSSWDTELLTRVGEALGAEALAAGVSVLLGPGINIKRSPLCGRNFEYLSEDPVLSGRLGAALVRGVQSRGVGASVKHFAANNQETERMRISVQADERTLREIYLAGFEHVVTSAEPWTVMAAYNRINGVFATENHWLLTEILRTEWGFDGLVVSDWNAVSDSVRAIEAGLDLQMPTTHGASIAKLVDAVNAGLLAQETLDRAVVRVLELVNRAARSRFGTVVPSVDFDAHHALARTAAAESAVLLKNDGAILPLDPASDARVAVIGEFARTPRFQGAGSSQVNATRVDHAWGALLAATGDRLRLTFSPGFTLSGDADDRLLAEAVVAAEVADVAVVFLGLPGAEESEGFDRVHLDLPPVQVRVLAAVATVNRNVVVVLANGGVVRVAPWEQYCSAVLEVWLAGQAGGGAIADLLVGRANPCGRLAETIPVRLQDNPSYLDFPGADGCVAYGERLYVGYRYYDAKEMAVDYPFGHGLSYTTFGYTDLRAEVEGQGADVLVRVRLTVTNSGPLAGKEVVQLYVGDRECSVDRPVRELATFTKIELASGQSIPVEFELGARSLSFFSTPDGRWLLEAGEFEIAVGASSRDLRLTTTVAVDAPARARQLSLSSTVGEWLGDAVGGPVLRRALDRAEGLSMATSPEILRMVESLPLDRAIQMSGGRLDVAGLDEVLDPAQ